MDHFSCVFWVMKLEMDLYSEEGKTSRCIKNE